VTLDAAYLQYDRRRAGMDHDLYAWSNLFERPVIRWPEEKSVAVWVVVSLEWFPIVPRDQGFRAPGHMQTPYPDYRHYTAREYGTRVGFYRFLDAFAKSGIRVSVAMNSAIARRYPSIVRDIVAAGHEIIAHATDMNATITSGLDPDAELAIIRESLDSIESVAGTRPRGWHSIARSQSWNTLPLLAQSGVAYQCDWVNDDMPYMMATPSGPVANLPLNHELSDRQVINVQQQSIDSYAEQLRDAHAWLSAESARHGARMLPIHLTPYITGLPYRIDAVEAVLKWLAAQPGTWFARGDEILDAWSPQVCGEAATP
jgi:hypothetical protein